MSLLPADFIPTRVCLLICELILTLPSLRAVPLLFGIEIWKGICYHGNDKSEQIWAGLQKSFQSGTFAKASTVCYGYKITQSGELVIDSAEAKVVTFIFRQFMSGNNLGKISDALARMGISSPTGKATWSRETISKLLNNEKYVGDVALGKTNVIAGI